MKQKKGLIILILILLALTVVYFGMRSMNARKQEKQEEKEKAEIIQVIKVKNLKEIAYSADDGSSMAFVKEDGTWYLKDDKETVLQQTAIQSIADQVSDIQAEREIKDPDSIESYGLDTPLYTITVTDEDGTAQNIYIAGSDYYMTTGDKEKVYTVSYSLINALEFDKDTLVDTSEETEAEE